MFLIHTLGILVAIYIMSAIMAEIIFTSETEKKLPTSVRIGFSYFLSLLYFYGAWVCISIRQAWVLGIILLIIYAYGKFGNLYKAIDGTHFIQLLKKHLKLLSVFLILANNLNSRWYQDLYIENFHTFKVDLQILFLRRNQMVIELYTHLFWGQKIKKLKYNLDLM